MTAIGRQVDSLGRHENQTTPAEARAIAEQAYIYAFPLVEGYKTLYKQAADSSSPEFKAPFNHLGHARNVATAQDTWVVTPNSDTPYSFAWLDLRSEPIMITMPKDREGSLLLGPTDRPANFQFRLPWNTDLWQRRRRFPHCGTCLEGHKSGRRQSCDSVRNTVALCIVSHATLQRRRPR